MAKNKPPRGRGRSRDRAADPSDRRHGRRVTAKARRGSAAGGPVWIYGVHAVVAALGNPARQCRRLLLTVDTRQSHGDRLAAAADRNPAPPVVEIVARQDIEARLPRDSVHQGVALETDPLDEITLDALCHDLRGEERACVVALDQVTDPRNVGAVLRAAASFGARAVIITERHAPGASGSLAKAAAGALERLPLIRVTNLSRALADLKEAGFWCAGLDGGAGTDLGAVDLPPRLVLVMGSEGAGLRRLSRENCDYLLRIPIAPDSESLNVATAAAVALYALSTAR